MPGKLGDPIGSRRAGRIAGAGERVPPRTLIQFSI